MPGRARLDFARLVGELVAYDRERDVFQRERGRLIDVNEGLAKDLVGHGATIEQLIEYSRGYVQGHPKIARLFPDSRTVERAYFKKTGIFPIMHAVAIKKSLLKQHPWLAKAVFDVSIRGKTLKTLRPINPFRSEFPGLRTRYVLSSSVTGEYLS